MNSSSDAPAPAAESLGNEVVADVKAFVQNTETDLLADAEAAYTWLKGELATLEPTVLADLKTAVSTAVTGALSGESSGDLVADTLDQLSADGAAVLSQVKSEVVTATVGLVASPAAS